MDLNSAIRGGLERRSRQRVGPYSHSVPLRQGPLLLDPSPSVSGPLPPARVLDLPPVRRYLEECVRREEASDLVQFVEGDFDQGELPGGTTQLSKATTSFMALNLMHQAGGRTWSATEVEAFAREAGFTATSLKKLRSPGFAVIACTRG